MNTMRFPKADNPVRRFYEVVDSETIRSLSDHVLFSPGDRTLVLALADAAQEIGTDRKWAIWFAARVHLGAVRAGRFTRAVRVIESDSRRGRLVRRLIRLHVRVLSDRVPIVVSYGWGEPVLSGQIGRMVVTRRNAIGRVEESHYEPSTLRIRVGSQWVLRLASQTARDRPDREN